MSAEKRLFNRKSELEAARAAVQFAQDEVKRLEAEVAGLTKKTEKDAE